MIQLDIPDLRRDAYRRAGWWQDRFIDSYVGLAAAAHPDGVAVIDGETILTYRQLDRAIQSAAAGLADLGVVRGDVVSWQLPNWWETLALHHAVLKLGAVSNPIVPIYRSREVGYILKQAHSRVVVVPDMFRGFDHPSMIAGLRRGLPDLEHVVVARPKEPRGHWFEKLLCTDPGGPIAVSRSADDPILLMFTSGTTADPKGVLHTHNTLDYENRSIVEVYCLTSNDVVFMPSPVTHMTGLLYGIQLPAMLGAPVVLQDVWDATTALRLIEQRRCSFTLAATPFLHSLVHHPDLSTVDTASLRVFACGGADVPSTLVREAAKRLGCVVTRVYGSTEFPTLSTSGFDAPEDKRCETDGRAIGAAEYRIVDDSDATLGDGELGELLVRGPEMFPSYLRTSDNTDALTVDGWFRTGDLAVSDAEGYVSIRGRKKDIILRGGENISGVEIENLLFQHPAVREIAVVAMPDPVMVERACAFVVPAPGTVPNLDELAQFLIVKGLARQKIPERLELVDDLPKTQSGKVQKFRLRELARSFTIDNARSEPPVDLAAP
jgi:cyclohexanecarboxylate-CoA ligase